MPRPYDRGMRYLILILFLGACAADPVGLIYTPNIGAAGAVSRKITVRHGPHHVLVAQSMATRRGNGIAYAVILARSYDGVHNGLRIENAWVSGRPAPFRAIRRNTPFCGVLHCSSQQIGTLLLNAPLFEAASKTGLPIHLLGPDGAFDLFLPRNSSEKP
jgi:hypothetical protein